MALFTLANSSDGWALDVLIGLPAAEARALHNAGLAIPPPVQVRAIIDSGSDVTNVAASVLLHFGLTPRTQTSTQTAGGARTVRLFDVSLSVPVFPMMAGAMLTRSTIMVVELTELLPNIEVLLGRDIPDECLLIADGPGKRFTLAW